MDEVLEQEKEKTKEIKIQVEIISDVSWVSDVLLKSELGYRLMARSEAPRRKRFELDVQKWHGLRMPYKPSSDVKLPTHEEFDLALWNAGFYTQPEREPEVKSLQFAYNNLFPTLKVIAKAITKNKEK